MKIEQSPELSVICFETQTSLSTLGPFVRHKARELYKVAADTGLEVLGPIYWIYQGADGLPDTPFQLTIALPIAPTSSPWQSETFTLKVLPAFRYVSQRHQGPWELLGQTYGELIGYLQQQGLQMSGENRELYLRMNFEQPAHHLTEVQVGVLP
ncbi:effector-binding domain-containing protein [Dyadobacter jejuensis]|uniref:Effector-binding domain-containing protein n=1 Tax=Dyadobacter jejuensis TaxID=1082580 RepID=A0A316ARA6_9BACT|nr:GyrI-like domain-containing protein [Dyadobacter jejuensis]PWJ59829.1 effector-binding domain-containing protein [Dyadobacter jejuensis]